MADSGHSSSSRPPSNFDPDTPRTGLAKLIPRRPRVTWVVGIVFAFVFATLVTPVITAERWLGSLDVTEVVKDQPAPVTVRVPAFAGLETVDNHLSGGGVVLARGEIASQDDAALAEAIAAATPRGLLPYIAFFVLLLVFVTVFTHHMRRSNLGRLVRVQLVSLTSIALVAVAAKVVLLGTALSVLVVPVALLAMVPTMVLDRTTGLATGVLAALVVSLLGPFDLGVAILMLVQAATAGLVVAERPKQRWKSALFAGVVTTLFTVATYVLITYLTTGKMPAIGDPLRSPWLAAAVGPMIAMLLTVPLIPLYQLLVGEITQGKLVELEDLSNPLLKQIAERSPGTWQHSLMMANMAEIAANTIGANGRLVRVGAYYHDLGKSLQPKYFIENLEPGETSPHDKLPPDASCDAIFAHVTEGIVAARKAGLHERIVDFMHMHHGDGVLEYFWGKCREQGNPRNMSIEEFRYPGHPPQSRETAILAICDAVEAASRTLKKPEPAAIQSLVQRIVYGKLHLGQLDE
ncbi:MAG: HDIG domain-containing metalloprotein, partial [Kofleriaceae bacterium]